jgi:hypothetical protein
LVTKMLGTTGRLGVRWRILVGLAVLGGLVLRVVVYRSTLGNMNSDEAETGLMMSHVLHGQFATFILRQSYGGTQEVILGAPVVWIFGPSTLAIRIVPILITAITALLIWRVGRRTVGEPAALVAGLLFWLWPPRLFALLLVPAFYASDVLYAALVLLLALRAKERPDAVRAGTYGLVLGLAFWQTSQIVPIMLGATVWLVPRILRQAWVAVPAAILGSLPWLIWNIRHDWASLHPNAGTDFTYAHRLRIFLSPILPQALGLRVPYSMTWIVPVLGIVIYVAAVGLFVWSGYRARRRDTFLLYMVAGLFPFLYAAAPKANLTNDPRYVTVLVPCLALIVAQLARDYWRAAVLLTVALAISATGLYRANAWTKQHDQNPWVTTARSLGPLIATLDQLGVRRVFTNYWIAYRLDFDTHERIVAVENGFDGLVVRRRDLVPTFDPRVIHPAYDREVRAGPHAFVFFHQEPPKASELAKLAAHGYTKHLVQGLVVWAPPVGPN